MRVDPDTARGDTPPNPHTEPPLQTPRAAAPAAPAIGLIRPRNPISLYRPSTLLWLTVFAALCVPLCTLVDVTIARHFEQRPLANELQSALDLALVVSHGGGVFLLLIGIVTMAPRRRWHVPRLATLAIGAGGLATIVKMFVLRPRPSHFRLDIATHDAAWLWAFDWELAQLAIYDASTRSFPSGKIATAVAFTVGLWVVLPRARWVVGILCASMLVQPVSSINHFLSDVCGGVAVGLLWSYVCYHPKLLGNLFDKMTYEGPRKRKRSETPDAKNPDSRNLDVGGDGVGNDPPDEQVESPLLPPSRRSAERAA